MITKCIVHFLLLLSFFSSIHSTDLFPSSAKLKTTWNVTAGEFYNSYDGSHYQLSTIILSEKISNSTEMPAICFGFTEASYPDSGYILSISARINCSRDDNSKLVLWSANRNTPVTSEATLEFDSLGDLILREADGNIVWSTDTSRKSVVGMRITATGNLFLYNENNTAVWSSFDDQSTDTWLPGRKLVLGQRIIANASPSKWTPGISMNSVLRVNIPDKEGAKPN